MNLDLYAKTQFSDGKSQFSGEKTQLREILRRCLEYLKMVLQDS